MDSEGEQVLSESGVASQSITHRRQADMRYVGQGHEVRVDLPNHHLGAADAATIQAEFEKTYRELYGRFGPSVPIEMINWRVVSAGPTPGLRLRSESENLGDADFARKGTRRAWFPEAKAYVDTPIYDRYRLAVGAHFEGPAIVEERESTVIIGGHSKCQIDEQRNLVVQIGE